MEGIVEKKQFAVPESYIDDIDGLQRLLVELKGETDFRACAIDTEADSMHSYETKLCLIQFAISNRLVILDPLGIGIENMEPFLRFVDAFDIVWMHGADYDISMFNSTFDWVPKTIFDTQVAARFLGIEKFGLANLLEEEYGIRLSKQSQKADWSRRPLTDKMLEYAFNDVRYLLDLGAKYLDRLEEMGRMDWFLESCEVARKVVLNREERSEDEIWRISGWGKLSTKGLNALKFLWHWRDDECRRLNRPAFKFLGNGPLLAMATALQEDREIDVPGHVRPAQARRLSQAIKNASEVPASEYPKKRKRANGPRLEIEESRLEEVRHHRDRVAGEMGIDPTVIATRQAMERLAATNFSDSERVELLMNWQQELLRPVIDPEST